MTKELTEFIHQINSGLKFKIERDERRDASYFVFDSGSRLNVNIIILDFVYLVNNVREIISDTEST